MIIGSHVSFGSEQLLGSAKQAVAYGANTFMFYTGAPQNTFRSKIDDELLKKAQNYMQNNGIDINNVICHAPYIINLANKEKEESWNFSISFLRQELERIKKMGVKYIVVHPGNSLKLDRMDALNNISEALNHVLEGIDGVQILLETMAGKGSECGKTTEELKIIIDGIKESEKVAICIDTCHLNDSGIDISKFDDYLNDFDKIIGIEKIKCVHVNDSKNIIASFKDRHENLGLGTIGFDNLINVIYNDKLKNVPKILETPWIDDNPPYKQEIDMIKEKRFNPNLVEEVKSFYK